jgi:hypothetical protein
MTYLKMANKFLLLTLMMNIFHVEAAPFSANLKQNINKQIYVPTFRIEPRSISARADAAFFTPPTASISESIANGDFFITGATRGRAIGDGGDESTIWAMNFRKTPNTYDNFRLHNPTTLTAATLKLKITPKTSGIYTDAVKIFGLPWIELDAMPVGATTNLTIDLLDHYEPEEILDALMRDRTTGVFYMIYQDDAIVSSAEVVLEY